jgi:hypothetical protein
MSKFIFYKQCIKVHSTLNLKFIKFNQILLEKHFWKFKMMHYSFCCKTARPAHSIREAQHEKTGLLARAHTRARPAKGPARVPRAPPHGRSRSGQGNLGPGRAFPSPPGPKEARSRAGRPQPHDQDRRLCVDFGETKTPSPFNPKTLAPFLLPPFASAFFFLSPSERASGGR